jgi:hypothetical protein
VVTHAGKVFHAAPPDKHDAVLLEVMTNAGNVRGAFNPIGKAHAGNLAESGVRLFGRSGEHAGANAPLLRTSVEGGTLCLVGKRLPPVADQLIDGRHIVLLNICGQELFRRRPERSKIL